MKTQKMLAEVLVLALSLVAGQSSPAGAEPMSTAFTYQGRLIDANNQADNIYDFQFKLFDDPNVILGNQVGRTLYVIGVDVIDGYFRAPLYFGDDPNIFNGEARWLEIGVRPHDDSPLPSGKGEPVPGADIYIEQDEDDYVRGPTVTYLPKSVAEGSSEYTILSPRQSMTPTPYAIYAQTASGGLCSCDCDGTPNYIAKFTDTNDLGDSVIYEDPVTRNIGIDASDPQEKLDVDGNVIVRGKALKVIGGPDSYIQVGNPQMGYWTTFSYESDPSSGMFDTYIKNLCGRGVGCDLIIDFPFGNVGIGTTNPQEKLHVVGNALVSGTLKVGENTIFMANPVNADAGIEIAANAQTTTPYNAYLALTARGIVGQNSWNIMRDGASADFLIRETMPHEPFSIDAFTIKTDGKVGIGTDDPQKLLHIVNNNGGYDGLGICLDPHGGGFVGGTIWDIDNDNGSLSFIKTPSPPNPPITVMTLANPTIFLNGKVGIGTTAPTEKLDVDGTARLRGISAAGGAVTTVVADYNGKLWRAGISSRRYKTNIQNLESDPGRVLELRPVRFQWKTTGQQDIGLIAEEVEAITKDLVIYDQEGRPDAVKYEKVAVYLLSVVKAQQHRIDTLEAAEAENESLVQRIEALEQMVRQQNVIVKEVQQ
jgi:hypothetical protein